MSNRQRKAKKRKPPQQTKPRPAPTQTNTYQSALQRVLDENQQPSPSDVLQLQRTLGNQTVMRLMYSRRQNNPNRGHKPIQRIEDSPYTEEQFNRTKRRRNAVIQIGANRNAVKKEAGDGGESGVSVLSEQVGLFGGASGMTEGGFSGFGPDGGSYKNTSEGELNEKNAAAQLGMSKFKKDGDKYTGQNTALGHGFTITSSALSTAGGASASIIGIIDLAGNIRQLYKGEVDRKDIAEHLSNTFFGAGSTGVSMLQTGTSTAGLVTKSVSAGGKDVGNAGGIIDSIAGSLGALGGLIGTAKSGVTLVYDGIKMHKAIQSKSKRTEAALTLSKDATDLIKNGLGTLKGAFETAQTIMNVIGGLSEAGKQFTQAVPFVGAAINIAMSALDIIMQGITLAGQALKVHRARKDRQHMDVTDIRGQLKSLNLDDDQVAALHHLREIAVKRIKRGALNLTSTCLQIIGDLGSIGSAIASIVGEATAAVYGVGVGIKIGSVVTGIASAGVKLSGTAATVGAKLLRYMKQKGRDLAAKKNWKNKIGKYRIFNTDKTTAKKNERYVNTTAALFTTLANLPDDFNNEKNQYKYEAALMMLNATGVSKTALFKETDATKQAAMIIKAMRERE